MDYYGTRLHVLAHEARLQDQLSIAAFEVMHLYNAFCGKSVTVDELLGRGERIDLVNDPMGLDQANISRMPWEDSNDG